MDKTCSPTDLPEVLGKILSLYSPVRNRLLIRVDFPRPDSPEEPNERKRVSACPPCYSSPHSTQWRWNTEWGHWLVSSITHVLFSLPTTISVKSKPFFTFFLWIWWGSEAKPTKDFPSSCVKEEKSYASCRWDSKHFKMLLHMLLESQDLRTSASNLHWYIWIVYTPWALGSGWVGSGRVSSVWGLQCGNPGVHVIKRIFSLSERSLWLRTIFSEAVLVITLHKMSAGQNTFQ